MVARTMAILLSPDIGPGFRAFFFSFNCPLSDTISALFEIIRNQALITIVYENLGFIPI